jgi:murein DD-endopeptidase MepM/ murein hydrolase activator NlpD
LDQPERHASWILVAPLLFVLGCGGELSGGPEGSEYGRSSFAPGSVVSICTPAGLGLNLRSAPGLQSSVIAVLASGSQATVLGVSGAWYRIQASQTGWAHGSYLCPGAGAPSPAPSGTFVRFVEPAPGSTQENGVKLRVAASANIATVRYFCDGYLLRTSSNAASGFAANYTFSVLGKRTVTAQALSAAGAKLASASVTITVTWPGAGGGSCTGSFSHPAPGYPVTDNFGTCRDGCTRTHTGIDLGTPYGTLIYAADGGKVDYASWVSGYGYMIDVLHCGKYTTRYAHLSQFLVQPGQWVSRGQPIARSGNSGVGTGPHLHFEIRIGGPYGTPVDPRNYISF